MKILVVQDYLRSGGTERQSLFLARAFREAGHSASLLTFRPGGELAPLAAGLLERPLQPFDLGLDWFAPGLLRRVRAYEPDVVIAMGRMANCQAGKLQRAFPRTVVVGTVRTGKPLPHLYQKSLAQVRHVIANSEETAAKLRAELGLAGSRLSVIYNSLVIPEAQESNEAEATQLRKEEGAGERTTVLLCVGTFRREKNQRALIEAAAALPAEAPWQLWFVGDGDERSACEDRVRELGLASRVKFFGFQKDPTVFYAAADLAVLASERESLSNFLIEAQYHGLPAVAFDAQGVRECLRDGETGRVIAFGDVRALAAAWLELIASPETRCRWGRAGAARARDLFAPKRQAEAYLTLFQALMKSCQETSAKV